MGNYYYTSEQTRTNSIVKVFGYMFLGLLVTALSAIGIYYLLISGTVSFNSYGIITIISSISLIILIFVTQFYCLKNKSGGLFVYSLYALCMGILMSSLMLTYSIRFLGYVFLCAAGSFGAMALYGMITKRSTISLGMFGVGALFGILALSLVNIFLQSEGIYYLLSYIGLAAMLAITAYDIQRAKQLANSGNMTEGVAIYMALQLYTDFIYIFIRLIVIMGRNRK